MKNDGIGVSAKLVAVMTNCAALTVAANFCYADTTPAANSSIVPSATTAVKAGDWINWQVERNVLTEVTDGTTQSNSMTTPTAADIAVAAVAVQSSISVQLAEDATKAAAMNSTQADKDQQQADLGALVLATAAVKKAGDPGAASKDGGAATAAALQIKTDAQTALDAAVKQAIQALQQNASNQESVSSAKTPTQTLKETAAASAKTAATAITAEFAATVYRDVAASTYDKAVANVVTLSSMTICAPPRSRFLVTNVTAPGSSRTTATNTTSGAQTTNNGNTATANVATVEGYYPSQFLFLHWASINEYAPPRRGGKTGSLAPPSGVNAPCGQGTKLPSYDTLYQFQATDTNIGAYYREGFTWGGMVIPYKFYVKDKTFKGNPSTVAFIGYEGWFPGVSLAGVMALGPGIAQSNSSTPTSSTSTKTSTSTVVTYTAATGLVATFDGVIKAGLLVGWDWQGSGNNFPYEGKTWIALSIGTSF